MKKILLIAISLILMSFLLVGCSFAWDDDGDLVSIEKIDRIVDADGNALLEIHYTNLDKVDRFELPRGNGIKDVQYVVNQEERATIITVTYTNELQSVFSVPFGEDGKDGTSITEVRLIKDLDNVPFLVFYCQDEEGTLKEQGKVNINELRGEDGADGIGFKSWEPFIDSLGEGVVITMTDGSEPMKYYFNYYRTVNYEYVENQYHVFTIVDGENNPIGDPIVIPRMAAWLTGNNMPLDSEGIVGDFYFDARRQVIYTKVESDDHVVYWKEIARLQSENYCTVTFNPVNGVIDGYESLLETDGYVFNNIPYGSYFLDKYPEIPTPTREGYEFVGWFRSFKASDSEVQFTSFVQVCGDLTLYARWRKID